MDMFEQWFVPDACQVSPALYATAVAVALFVTAFSKGGFGGLGALAVPILMMVMPGTVAVGMWLPVLILCDLCTVPHYPKERSWRPILLLAPWTLAGLFIGRALLDRVTPETDNWLKVGVGALSILFAAAQAGRYWLAKRTERQLRPWKPSIWHALPFGLSAGITTMLAHAAGSIVTMFLLPQRLGKREFVGTCARYYLIFNTVKVPFLVQGGYITAESLRWILWLIPLAPLGVFAGSSLNKKISNRSFEVVIYVLLVATGIWLIWKNVSLTPATGLGEPAAT